MTDLLWPGDHRAGDRFTDGQVLGAMLAVEESWLGVLVDAGVAPESARSTLRLRQEHVERIEVQSELAGNPVPALVELLREDPDLSPETRQWLHRGLTSQDVLDTALMWSLGEVIREIADDLRRQVISLAGLARTHRETPTVARTLTQHAVPTTFGLKVATWLTAVLDAYDDVSGLTFPAQIGGAAGTMAAAVELGLDAEAARARVAADLGLADVPAWHTVRSTVTRAGDALVRCTDAWGRIANDVLTLSRPEIGEVYEGEGGPSSTMPDKANPVLSVLVRRAALTTPTLAATLHLAAADQVDERADGGWHAEWAPLRDLARRTLVAGAQTTDLLDGLVVNPDRMAATLAAAGDAVLAEQRAMVVLTGRDPQEDYLGESASLVDAVLDRARTLTEESP
jgi:3-carboxy-cis,cis-muconate cycloisomerase